MNYKQRAYDYVREQIFAGSIRAGSRVSDYSVANAVGVSRTPVREALTQLTTEGFLEQIPKQGFFVKTLSRKELAELFDIRVLLEGYAVERATDSIGARRIAELERICDELKETIEEMRGCGRLKVSDPRVRKQILNDVVFHLSIIRACESPRVLRMVSDLRLLTQLFSNKQLESWLSDPISPLLQTWDEHRSIVEAIRARKPKEARERMEAHLVLGKRRALESFDEIQAKETDGGIPLQVTDLIRQMEAEQPDDDSI